MPLSPSRAALAAVAEQIRVITVPVFAGLDTLTEATHSLVDTNDAGALASQAAREMLAPTATRLLENQRLIVGCGVAVAGNREGDDERPTMAWWVRRNGEISAKRHVFNPGSDSFYDIRQTTWFAEPRRTGKPVLLAPYVDSWGTDDLTMTACRPLSRDGIVVAVIAADLNARAYVSAVERILKDVGSPIALIDAEDRVIASVGLDLEAGARLLNIPEGKAMKRSPGVAAFGWRLARTLEKPG